MKKALTESQTLRAGCNKAEPNISAPPQTPFPVPERGTLVTSWRWSLPLPTNPIWWGSMHAISNYCGNRPTHAHTHTHTPIHKQTGPITIHCAAASAQCNNRSQLVLEYSTRCLTGSQWRSRNREVTWSRRDEPATRRTAVLRMDCRLILRRRTSLFGYITRLDAAVSAHQALCLHTNINCCCCDLQAGQQTKYCTNCTIRCLVFIRKKRQINK